MQKSDLSAKYRPKIDSNMKFLDKNIGMVIFWIWAIVTILGAGGLLYRAITI